MKALTDAWRPEPSRDQILSRDDLVLKYVPLVRYVLNRLHVFLPSHLDHEDLVAVGTVGLISAAEKYDRSRNVKFNTYAVPRIRGAILDELRGHDWVPRSAREKAGRTESVREELRRRLDRDPTVDEIAEGMGITPVQARKLLADIRFPSVHSFDDVSPGSAEPFGTDPCFEDSASPDPVEASERQEVKQIVANAIADLPERERIVVTLYYAEDLMLKEVGEILDLSESRVSQLLNRALRRLRPRVSGAVAV